MFFPLPINEYLKLIKNENVVGEGDSSFCEFVLGVSGLHLHREHLLSEDKPGTCVQFVAGRIQRYGRWKDQVFLFKDRTVA